MFGIKELRLKVGRLEDDRMAHDLNDWSFGGRKWDAQMIIDRIASIERHLGIEYTHPHPTTAGGHHTKVAKTP